LHSAGSRNVLPAAACKFCGSVQDRDLFGCRLSGKAVRRPSRDCATHTDTCSGGVTESGTIFMVQLEILRADRDSSAGVANRYGLDVSEFARWCDQEISPFPYSPGPALRFTQPPVHCVPRHSRG
jgi:hypothetical protein